MKSRYDEYFERKKAKNALQSELDSGAIVDESGPLGKGVAQTDWFGRSNLTQNDNVEPIAGAKPESSGASQGAMAAGQTAAQGGNALDTVSSGLMMSGNPKAMAAGLALQTVNQVNKQKQQNEQNRYLAEVQRVKARQDAIDRLAQIGQNLRA